MRIVNLLVLVLMGASFFQHAPEYLTQPAPFVAGAVGGSLLTSLPFLSALAGMSSRKISITRLAVRITQLYLFVIVCACIGAWFRVMDTSTVDPMLLGLTLIAVVACILLGLNLSALNERERRLMAGAPDAEVDLP